MRPSEHVKVIAKQDSYGLDATLDEDDEDSIDSETSDIET